jgi:hypothetical protein
MEDVCVSWLGDGDTVNEGGMPAGGHHTTIIMRRSCVQTEAAPTRDAGLLLTLWRLPSLQATPRLQRPQDAGREADLKALTPRVQLIAPHNLTLTSSICHLGIILCATWPVPLSRDNATPIWLRAPLSLHVGCEPWHAPLVRLVFHLVRRLLLLVRHGWTSGRSHSLNMPDLVLFSAPDTPTYLRV